MDNFLLRLGIDNPEVRWLINAQLLITIFVILLLGGFGLKDYLIGFAIGSLLVSFNFFLLARMIPKLIYIRKGAVLPLLFSFYARLALTAIILYFAIAWLKVSVVALLVGLSTILLTSLFWLGKSIWRMKQEEA